jgi:hypothetical protein
MSRLKAVPHKANVADAAPGRKNVAEAAIQEEYLTEAPTHENYSTATAVYNNYLTGAATYKEYFPEAATHYDNLLVLVDTAARAASYDVGKSNGSAGGSAAIRSSAGYFWRSRSGIFTFLPESSCMSCSAFTIPFPSK